MPAEMPIDLGLTMQSLLRWGVENTANDGSHQPSQARQPLDTAIIDHILGKPDSQLMKEALAVAVDEVHEEDIRVGALDELEVLIENIDNANDMEKLKMWNPLHELLTSPSSSDLIKLHTLWVIGTAVQNNPSAQNTYLSISPFPDLLSVLSSSPNPQTRSKAMYALSGTLKHNLPAVEAFGAADGWVHLRNAIKDPDITVRRKAVFLINTLLKRTAPGDNREDHPSLHTPTGPVHANSHASMISDPRSTQTSAVTLEALRDQGLLKALISALTAPMPHGDDGENEGDADLEEKIVRVLQTFSNDCGGRFSPEEKKELRKFFDAERGPESTLYEWGINAEEMDALKLAIS